MTNSGWIISFYLPFDATRSVRHIGNYEHLGSRYLDDIVVFSGMYGFDYMKWYVHKDLVSYNFEKYSIELKLYKDGDTSQAYYQNKFRIIVVSDDDDSDRKVVHCISQDQALLSGPIMDLKLASLPYDETRTPEKILTEVLGKDVFSVHFHEHDNPKKKSFLFQYPKFTFDPLDTVYDFINYIANENNFEWGIWRNHLFIGPEIKAFEEFNAKKPYINPSVDNISISTFFHKITWAASPLDITYYYEMDVGVHKRKLRCVWAKHWVGANGDMTKGCFVVIGTKVNKEIYRMSFDGYWELLMFDKFLYQNKHFNQMRMGRIMRDEGDSSYVDLVSIEKDKDNYAKKIPREFIMNISDPLYTLPKVGKTAEYLDDGAGQLFPRVNDVTKAPNSIIYAINDRIEQSVVGPFVIGNGSDSFKIIKKNSDDYRFSLPNGWTMYVDNEGNTLIQTDGIDAESIPERDNTKVSIKLEKDGDVYITCGGNSQFLINDGTLQASLIGHTHSHNSHIHTVTPGALIPGPPSTTSSVADSSVGESDKHSKHLRCVAE